MTATVTGFQVMPALSDEEYRALEESIREHGVQVPITVAPDGRMVDGHHRAEIAAKFDLHCPRVTAKGDDTQLRTLAFELNNHRRQQGREARRGQVHKSLRADPHLSNREHARRTGVHHETVQSIRADMEACGEIRHTDTRTDSTGREQVSSKPERTSVPTTPEAFEAKYGMRPDEADALLSSGLVKDREEFDQAAAYLSRVDKTTGANSVSHPGPVTGPDGKTYQHPEPREQKVRRRPITDAAGDAGWNLRKAIERLERIAEDDRFSRNKEEVTAHLRGHLLYAVEVCQDLLDHHLQEGA